jgi:predicted component of type VI protein secretion system
LIDDMLASRVHAKVSVTEDTAVLRDLTSANGVMLNGARVDMPVALRDGDQILIGTQELSVYSVDEPSYARDEPATKKPPPAVPARSDLAGVKSTDPGPRVHTIEQGSKHMERTEKADAFQQLGALAERMLEAGRPADAERVLSGHLKGVLEEARSGRVVPPGVVESASKHAMRFAAARLDPKWLDYVVELHMLSRKPMRAHFIDELCALGRKNITCDGDLLLFYKAALQRAEPDMPLADRVLCARILSLEVR